MSFEKFTGKVLEQYDHGELDHAVAYGSGAFRQNSYADHEKPMVDFMFAVRDPKVWHRRNIAAHPEDYSMLRFLGAKVVAQVQEMGAGMYYNPYVRLEAQEIKYGVISSRRLLEDLINWDTLYAAGRHHKPVKTLTSTPEVVEAREVNLQSALAAARLLLPERFTEQELFHRIAGLSYKGDVRLENRNKVQNIVDANMVGFRKMYEPFLQQAFEMSIHSGGACIQNTNADTREHLLEQLPDSVTKNSDLDPSLSTEAIQGLLQAQLRKIIKRSSLTMTFKGIATAGPKRSARYGWEKLKKSLKK